MVLQVAQYCGIRVCKECENVTMPVVVNIIELDQLIPFLSSSNALYFHLWECGGEVILPIRG